MKLCLTNRFLGMMCAFTAAGLWATVGVTIKLTLAQLDGFTVAIWVSLLTTIILGIKLGFQRKYHATFQEWQKQPFFFGLVGVLGLGIQQTFYLKGYQLLPASQVVAIFYLYPLLMLLFSALGFRERISSKSLLCILVGCTGIYLLVSQGQWLSFKLGWGTSYTLLAAIAWALFSVFLKSRNFDSDIGLFLFNVWGLGFLIGMIPAFGLTWQLTGIQLCGILYLAVFPTAIAFSVWNQALRLIPTGVCANIALLSPLLSILLAVVVLHESFSAYQFAGLILLISSTYLNLS